MDVYHWIAECIRSVLKVSTQQKIIQIIQIIKHKVNKIEKINRSEKMKEKTL